MGYCFKNSFKKDTHSSWLIFKVVSYIRSSSVMFYFIFCCKLHNILAIWIEIRFCFCFGLVFFLIAKCNPFINLLKYFSEYLKTFPSSKRLLRYSWMFPYINWMIPSTWLWAIHMIVSQCRIYKSLAQWNQDLEYRYICILGLIHIGHFGCWVDWSRKNLLRLRCRDVPLGILLQSEQQMTPCRLISYQLSTSFDCLRRIRGREIIILCHSSLPQLVTFSTLPLPWFPFLILLAFLLLP